MLCCYFVTTAFLIAHPSAQSFSHCDNSVMPTTRSTLPVNCSGLQQGSRQSKRKRSIGNTDEHAHKRLKDKIDSDVGEEEGEQRMKGGRGGKKAKGMKKAKHLRFVWHLPYLRY